MLEVSCDHGVCEVNADGKSSEIILDAICAILAIDEGLGDKNPAAQNAFRDMLKDGDIFERFAGTKQMKVKANDRTRKIAKSIIELRKEIENDD